MPAIPLSQESTKQAGFYVPRFQIKIAGAGLRDDVLADVTRVTVRDALKKIDGFELTLNNWDVKGNCFKFVGSENTDSLKQNPLHTLFDPGKSLVEVRMGYGGGLRIMMQGTFTSLQPSFPREGPPVLTVSGLDILHQLRPRQYTTTWEGKTDSEIAEAISARSDPRTGKKRFPLPIVTNPKAKGREKPFQHVTQKNQFDIDFLMDRATARGYVVYVIEGDPKKKGIEAKRRLYFGPSDDPGRPKRDMTFELEWGKSLLDFRPTLGTANQIRSATVHGWNRETKEPIRETVTLADPRLKVNRDLHPLLEGPAARDEEVVDEPVHTPAEARERATAILSDRHKQLVTARATSVGLPDLRAGQYVEIVGVGVRFSGTYLVTETIHTIGDSGYTTTFAAQRQDEKQKGRTK